MFDRIQISELKEMNRNELDCGKLLVTDRSHGHSRPSGQTHMGNTPCTHRNTPPPSSTHIHWLGCQEQRVCLSRCFFKTIFVDGSALPESSAFMSSSISWWWEATLVESGLRSAAEMASSRLVPKQLGRLA